MGLFTIFTGGRKETKPYPGYNLCYGAKPYSEIKSSGFIPLIARVYKSGGYLHTSATPTGKSWSCVLNATINGVTKTFTTWGLSSFSSNVQITGITSNAYVDLVDVFADDDFTNLLNLTNLTVTSNGNGANNPTFSFEITCWLEPIGGGYRF